MVRMETFFGHPEDVGKLRGAPRRMDPRYSVLQVQGVTAASSWNTQTHTDAGAVGRRLAHWGSG